MTLAEPDEPSSIEYRLVPRKWLRWERFGSSIRGGSDRAIKTPDWHMGGPARNLFPCQFLYINLFGPIEPQGLLWNCNSCKCNLFNFRSRIKKHNFGKRHQLKATSMGCQQNIKHCTNPPVLWKTIVISLERRVPGFVLLSSLNSIILLFSLLQRAPRVLGGRYKLAYNRRHQ